MFETNHVIYLYFFFYLCINVDNKNLELGMPGRKVFVCPIAKDYDSVSIYDHIISYK